MTLNGLIYAEVPLKEYSTHSLYTVLRVGAALDKYTFYYAQQARDFDSS